jgi:hypothetical protein
MTKHPYIEPKPSVVLNAMPGGATRNPKRPRLQDVKGCLGRERPHCMDVLGSLKNDQASIHVLRFLKADHKLCL